MSVYASWPPSCSFPLVMTSSLIHRNFTFDSTFCSKERNCSRPPKHKGRCNNLRKGHKVNFWENSPLFKLNKQRGKLRDRVEAVRLDESRLEERTAEAESMVKQSDERIRESGNFFLYIFLISTRN